MSTTQNRVPQHQRRPQGYFAERPDVSGANKKGALTKRVKTIHQGLTAIFSLDQADLLLYI